MARQLDDDKRAAILDAAVAEFGSAGYERATMKSIATRANIAPGSIYTYFEDKGSLFRSAFTDAWTQFHREMRRVVALGKSRADTLFDIVDIGFDIISTLQPVLQGMFHEALRRDLLSGNIDLLCVELDELMSDEVRLFHPAIAEPAMRRYLLRVLITGILFSIALVPPARLPDEVATIKQTIRGIIAGSVSAGGQDR